jgi:serine/threonine-protein kinase
VIRRFKQEAKNQAKLTHPNIVTVFDFIQEENMLGIVMEYIEGETLEQLIQRKIRLDLLESIQIFKQVLNGIEYAHSKGFVHRDLKPSNIIITKDGIVKIMDFGISKSIFEDHLNIARKNIGTLQYMSPEQVRGEKSIVQSDLYSLGITFYEMLAGQTPFEYDTEEEVIDGQLNQQPASVLSYSPELPEEIDSIFIKLLAKDPVERFKSAKEFLRELEILTNSIQQNSYSEDRLKTFSTKKYKIKAVFYSTLIFIIGLVTIYLIVTQVLIQWKSGKNVLLLEDSRSKDSLTVRKSEQKLNLEILKSGINEDLNSIFFINPASGFSCGNNGTLIKTTDFGRSWQKTVLPFRFNFTNVCFTKAGDGFIVGDSSVILRTTDNGNNWFKVDLADASSCIRIKFIDDINGYILGKGGLILKTNDGGNSWYSITADSQNLLYDVSFFDKRNGFIVGWAGEILKTIDSGESWSVEKNLGLSYLKAIRFVNKEIGFIVGGEGVIIKTENSGEDWKIYQSKSHDGLYDLCFVNSLNGYIVGAKGKIMFTTDGGKTWDEDRLSTYATLTGIYKSSNGFIYAVGVNGTIIKIKPHK